jgi:hypothetical protein
MLKGQRSLLRSWVTKTAKQQMVTAQAHSKDSADAVSTEHWKYTKLPNLLQKFFADNICSASETGLFHCATLVGSLSYKLATL